MNQSVERRAVLLGGTGLIGSHLLALLAARSEYTQVTVITRRSMPMPSDRCRNVVIPLTELDQARDAFAGADVFCCLGTTIKQAGSRDAFRQVDFDFVVEAARLTASEGGKRFICVSAVNADAGALAFYARVKGEMEQTVQQSDIPVIAFMQPSLLQGERADFRLGEEVGQRVLALVRPLTAWSKAAWLPIDASTVAHAMVSVAMNDSLEGVHRYRYRDMTDLADRVNQEE